MPRYASAAVAGALIWTIAVGMATAGEGTGTLSNQEAASIAENILCWKPVGPDIEEPCFPFHSAAPFGPRFDGVDDADNCCSSRPKCWSPLFDDDDCWLDRDTKALHFLKNRPLSCQGSGFTQRGPKACVAGILDDGRGSLATASHKDNVTYSVGGELRYRYLDERNRLRPPLAAGRSNYQQWRFTPSLQLNYQDWLTGYVQAIDAPTFGEDLPQLPIDENRADLLQYYVDLKLWSFQTGDLRFRYGRQFLLYGSQHLISPLGWANTFRNFEGYKLYYSGESWKIDAFAVQPVNGAAGNINRPTSFDTPDQSRWFSGVYATYQDLPHSVIDLYWLWLNEEEPQVDRIDGNRHTVGVRWSGAAPHKDQYGDVLLTWVWDVEGAYQFGKDDFLSGANQNVQAGFASLIAGPTFNQLPWTPNVSGILFWGSGDDDPGDGTIRTVSMLFSLGHAYWGLIDNFSGQNLIDYGVQATVKPTQRLTFLTAWHWFDKAAREDAIYNVAGTPFGGLSTTAANIGNELDLVATYQLNANLQLQAGYFWFWYGQAVTRNPNVLVADRKHAEQFYLMLDWSF